MITLDWMHRVVLVRGTKIWIRIKFLISFDMSENWKVLQHAASVDMLSVIESSWIKLKYHGAVSNYPTTDVGISCSALCIKLNSDQTFVAARKVSHQRGFLWLYDLYRLSYQRCQKWEETRLPVEMYECEMGNYWAEISKSMSGDWKKGRKEERKKERKKGREKERKKERKKKKKDVLCLA